MSWCDCPFSLLLELLGKIWVSCGMLMEQLIIAIPEIIASLIFPLFCKIPSAIRLHLQDCKENFFFLFF